MKQRWLLLLVSLALVVGVAGFVPAGITRAAPQDNTYQTLPFTQNWSNTGLITTNDDWSGVPGIIGYRGDGLGSTNTNPQTILVDGTATPIDVNANQTNPNTFATGGVTEFHITDAVVALSGSGTADAPFILISLNTSGYRNVRIQYNLRDIDGSTDDAAQQVALHYRVGSTGNFTNLPAGYVADATTGPSLATLVTPIDVTLPTAADNQAQVQIRIMTTDATGNDEWVGIDDISVTGERTTYHTITFDGTVNEPSEWVANTEKLGTATIPYYLTWDDTYLYVGMIGGDTGNDKYNLLIDIDPDDTGAANSGTTAAYCGATFGADGKPDYAIQKYPGGVAQAQGSGGWNAWTPTAETTALNGTNQVEFRVRWSDIGLSSRSAPVGLYLYACNSSDLVWSAWPPSNLQWTGGAQELTTRAYFPTTDGGRAPRTYAQQRGDQTVFNATGSVSLLNGFAQLNITAGGGAGCDVKVRVRGNAAVTTANNSVRRLYDITPTGCTPTADVTLKYLDGTEYEAVDELNGATEANLHLFHWNGSSWIDEGGTVNTGNHTMTRTGVSSFSPWTFGGSAPTAITLTTFSGRTPTNNGWIVLILLAAGVLLAGGWALRRRSQL